jgi:alpha-D-ribose 1-methylphosphonate 5-triphosphate synthase subunit PhnH
MQRLTGFADRSRDAARCFRAALDAMAQPGTLANVALPDDPPAPLSHAAAALLLTLSDADATVWLAGVWAAPEVDTLLRLRCGAAPATDTRSAAFAVGDWNALRGVPEWRRGEADYPDRAITLIVEVERLTAGHGVRLTGPGVRGETRLGVQGVDAAFWSLIAENARTTPLGLDVFVTAGHSLAALPRSVRIAR